MGQQVHVLPPKTIEKMKKYYAQALQSSPQGAVFRAKNANAVITAYQSGKVLFQGAAPGTEVEKWVCADNTSPTKNRAVSRKQSGYEPPASLFKMSHIGSDEAGTGDYFGPITVACCYVEETRITKLKQLGVKDSKNLTDDTIRRLAKEIINLRIPYSLLVLRNEKYNKLQKQGWSQGKMKAMLHHEAVDHLLRKIDDASLAGILIDQFCEPGLYKKYIGSENKSLPSKTFFMTKAESYSIAVAAGSIIARASFLNEMDKLSDTVGIRLPKGASRFVDQAAAEVIHKQGHRKLNSCAKVHFANTNKAEKHL